MGRPFANEIRALSKTYAWARTIDITRLSDAVLHMRDMPIITVGSGGSHSAALLLEQLHQSATGYLSRHLTPLQVSFLERSPQRFGAWLLSARGRNVDIRAAYQAICQLEADRIGLVCASTGSPLASEVLTDPSNSVFDFDVPGGRDGFLATNSLLASAIMLVRAYGAFPGGATMLPETFEELFGAKGAEPELPPPSFWDSDTFIVLYGRAGTIAAADLESKFSEAALGSVLPADYRNFAHGRHHWLAKYAASTSIVAFIGDDDRDIADRTLALIPGDISCARVPLSGTLPIAWLKGLAYTMFLTRDAGIAKGIDPGRPGVPEFGSKLYHLRPRKAKRVSPCSVLETIAIERKARKSVRALALAGELDDWRAARAEVIRTLASTEFGSIVFDLDGTLLDERLGEIPSEILEGLGRLLAAGIFVGVATGRGGSARVLLRSSLDRSLWHRIVVGYHNGSTVATLADDEIAGANEDTAVALVPVLNRLLTTTRDEAIQIAPGMQQISLRPTAEKALINCDELFRIAEEAIQGTEAAGLTVVRSSHSVDILAPNVHKTAVAAYIKNELGAQLPTLAIGDMGEWSGNDFELLNSPFGLSVDRVSGERNACWNLLPAGYRRARGTSYYLSRTTPIGEGRFSYSELGVLS